MSERKCPYCGSTDFVPIELYASTENDPNVDSVACTRCGHVEITVKAGYMRRVIAERDDRESECGVRRYGPMSQELVDRPLTKEEYDRMHAKGLLTDEEYEIRLRRLEGRR